jgi:hypothetical protein
MVEKFKTHVGKQRENRDRELGVSLVEVLVYIALFTILTTIVLAIINVTISSSQRITSSSTTQAKMNQAASMLQREISLAKAVSYAAPNRIDVLVRQNEIEQKVSYFAYIPGTTSTFPAGVTVSQMPAYNAVMRVTYAANGTTVTSVAPLVSGYDPAGYSKPLFTYFDKANAELVLNASSTIDDHAGISRIEFHIAAKADGRNSALQIESSAVPLFSSPITTATDEPAPLEPECAANFRASITPRNTYATLNWNAPAGATSYTIYRYNVSNGNTLEGSTIVANPGTTTLSNSGVTAGLAWGTTYRWTISVASPGYLKNECADTTATVVPAQVQLVNINSYATDLTTTNPATSLNLGFPTNGGEENRTKTTTNRQAGYRYTVARGLINQLAWSSRFGATSYNIYANGGTTPIITISNGNTYYQDLASSRVNYGRSTTYTVSASNAGGEGSKSSAITLISPPSAPALQAPNDSAQPGSDPVRPDASVTLNGTTYSPTSTKTINRLILRTAATNATAYRAYAYQGNTAATTNCTTGGLSYQASLNFKTGGAVDPNAQWGSYDCYAIAGYNDAGIGAMSTPVGIKQYPGPFNLNGSISSSEYNWLDKSRPNWGNGKCWVDPWDYATTEFTCSGIQSFYGFKNDPKPNGLFDKVDDSYTDIYVSWTRSLNSTGGYVLQRNILSNGVKCGTSSKANVSGCPYGGTASANFNYGSASKVTARLHYEMPGAAYEYTVSAKSAAGALRSKAGNRILTKPDIPSRGETFYEHVGTQRRIVATVLASTRLGNSTSITVESGRTTGKSNSYTRDDTYASWTRPTVTSNGNETTFLCNGGAENWGKGCVGPDLKNRTDGPYNYNARSYQTNWTYDGSTVKSRLIWKYGVMVRADHDGYTSWTRYPDRWPDYWTGAHAGYWSGYQSHAPRTSFSDGTVIPPSKPLEADESAKEECSTRLETDPLYTEECQYGVGIPPAPLDVTVGNPTYNSTTKVTTYTITWSQVAGASAYQYRTSDAANAATTEVTGTSATVTVPAGQTLKFSVRTKNLNNLSSFSDIKPLASQSLSAVSLNIPTVTATKIPLTWNAVTGATRYDIYRSSNGGSSYSLMNTVTTNKYDVTWTQNSGVQYRFYIVAKNSNNSVTSNVITVNGKLTTPTLTATANGKTVNLSWNQVTGAQNYEVSRSINGGAWTVLDTPSGTSYAETLSGTPNPGTKYAYRIRAINTYVNSGYSTTATVTF